MQKRGIRQNLTSVVEFRYAISGGLNGLIGIATIILVQSLTGNAFLANTSGYIAGFISGYFLHLKITFRRNMHAKNIIGYIFIWLTAFILNLIVLQCTLYLSSNSLYAQFYGIIAFVCYNYIGQRFFLYKTRD